MFRNISLPKTKAPGELPSVVETLARIACIVQKSTIEMVVISVVGRPWSPVIAELTLGFTAAEPPEAHVHGFHLFGDDGFIGDTKCCGVVGLMGDLGCGQPISTREFRSGTISLAQT